MHAALPTQLVANLALGWPIRMVLLFHPSPCLGAPAHPVSWQFNRQFRTATRSGWELPVEDGRLCEGFTRKRGLLDGSDGRSCESGVYMPSFERTLISLSFAGDRKASCSITHFCASSLELKCATNKIDSHGSCASS